MAELRGRGRRSPAAESLEEFVAALERPRRIIVMVKAGAPVDGVIDDLAPLLDEDDIVIDAGNSHFADTRRRTEALRERGPALHRHRASPAARRARCSGPSIMPGGDARGLRRGRGGLHRRSPRRSTASRAARYIGPDGAGHYVKMVHNGIEYADMQLIAEAYDLLRSRRRARRAGDREDLRRVERRRPRVVPDRDHRHGAGQDRRGDRQAAGRRDRRPGRAEGHRPLDRAGRARARRAADRDHRGRVRALAVGAARPAQAARRARSPARGRARASDRPTTSSTTSAQALYAAKVVAYAQGFEQMARGRRRLRLGPRHGRAGQDLARRLHHPRALPEPHPRGLRRAPATS